MAAGGRKSRARSKARRQQERKSRKIAQQAQYCAWRDSGQNSRSVRARRASKRSKLVSVFNHPQGECGNAGCRKCNPIALGG